MRDGGIRAADAGASASGGADREFGWYHARTDESKRHERACGIGITGNTRRVQRKAKAARTVFRAIEYGIAASAVLLFEMRKGNTTLEYIS
jgi:hypothetical protein